MSELDKITIEALQNNLDLVIAARDELIKENAALKAECERLKESNITLNKMLASSGLSEQNAALHQSLKEAVEALGQANYQGDYYDQKPHKAMEVVYKNRETLASIKQRHGEL